MTWTTQQRFRTGYGLSGYHTGDGPALILLHGVGLRSEAWNGLSEYLRDSFSIFAIDLPGHGDSESLGAAASTLEDYANVIAAYLKSFGRPVSLAGHSMGAMIALDIAMRFPDRVKSIAALNAIYRRSDIASKAVKARAEALKGISKNDLNTDVTLMRWFEESPAEEATQAAQACKTWLHETSMPEYQRAYDIFAHHDGPTSAQLGELQAATLFITGADEPNSTPNMSRAMADIAPLGTAKIIPGAAHMMPMTHAKQVAAALKHHFIG